MKNTSITVSEKSNAIVFTGAAEFTNEELETVNKQLSDVARGRMEVMQKEYLQLDTARLELQAEIRRVERRVKESPEYIKLMALKADLRMLNARTDELRVKAHGLLEAALHGVRRSTQLYKKLIMMLAADGNAASK